MVTVCAPALNNVPTVLCPPACSLSSPAPRRRVTAAAELLPFFVSSYLFASWYAREPLSCGQRCDDPACHLCRLQRWALASSALSGVPLQWPGLHSHRSSCPFAERARNALLMPASVILSCLPWSRCVRRPLSPSPHALSRVPVLAVLTPPCPSHRVQAGRRYDARTTIFSPEGRLYQVEYAMEAIGHAGAAVGVLSPHGIVLAAEKKITSKLLEVAKTSEKMYIVDKHVACAVAVCGSMRCTGGRAASAGSRALPGGHAALARPHGQPPLLGRLRGVWLSVWPSTMEASHCGCGI